MRDFHLHSLTLFGLGAAIAVAPVAPLQAAEPSATELEPLTMTVWVESSPKPQLTPSVAVDTVAVDSRVAPQRLNHSPIKPMANQVVGAETRVAPAVPALAQTEMPADTPTVAEDPSAPLEEPEEPDEAPVSSPASEAEGAADNPLMEEAMPAVDEEGATESPAVTEPSSNQRPDPLPEYLQPSGNPLLVPVQPEEVEILGTQPLALETAVELAYRNNEDLQEALLQLEQSQAALREARAALYPTLDGTAQVQANNSASPSDNVSPFFSGNTDATTTTATAGLDLSYDLGISGGRRARIEAAEAAVRGAELEVDRVQSQLRLDTITDYYAIQEATAQIDINQAFLEEAERNLNDTILREEVGVGTRFDVLRSQVQVANARQNVIRSRSQLRTAQRQLAARLNVPPSINVDTLPVAIAGTWPLSLEESIVLAYQGRAELEQLLVQREIAQAQRQIALSAVRPEAALFANYSVIQGFSTNLSSFDDGYTVGARLQWRLLDGGAAAAAAEQSALDAEIAESNFSQTLNDIRFQVEQAYFNLEANLENIDTAQLAVEQAEEAVELANLRFNAGVGTQLDVLTATSELADARGNLITAILDYNRALANLERSVSNVDLRAVEVP